jgi:hypothetical protein
MAPATRPARTALTHADRRSLLIRSMAQPPIFDFVTGIIPAFYSYK